MFAAEVMQPIARVASCGSNISSTTLTENGCLIDKAKRILIRKLRHNLRLPTLSPSSDNIQMRHSKSPRLNDVWRLHRRAAIQTLRTLRTHWYYGIRKNSQEKQIAVFGKSSTPTHTASTSSQKTPTLGLAGFQWTDEATKLMHLHNILNILQAVSSSELHQLQLLPIIHLQTDANDR